MRLRLALVVATLIAAPAAAHHGTGGFDTTKPVTLRGTVANAEWINPHLVLTLDARNADGSVEQWTIALSPPNAMIRKGIARNTIKKGDVVSAIGYSSTTLTRTLTATEFTLPDGRSFTTGNANFNPLDTSVPRQLPVQKK